MGQASSLTRCEFTMDTLLVAIASFLGFLVAYHTYGRWLAHRIFGLDPNAIVPSQQMRDDVDFVPTRKEIIFGHHFTSIAGTGPIVGPALAVFWGWLPALLWVVFGSIFIGAVHDFGALVVSLRNRGQTVGQVAGRLISRRARVLFLLTLFFALTIVLAIFGLVIALIFASYPESVLSVWIEIPLAVFIGYRVYRHGAGLLGLSIAALTIMYFCVWLGVHYVPIDLSQILGIPLLGESTLNTVVVWTLALMAYCFVASVLPVWTLLQPRDYINSHQLMLAMGLLCLGLLAAGLTGQAQLAAGAPMIATNIPADAPPMWPFLFITIACGAISGFHCLVSSGTTSKQLACETDAQYVGYGAMLLEGALAVIVILACCAGVGMGKFDRVPEGNLHRYVAATDADGQLIAGRSAWQARYNTAKKWEAFNKLTPKIGAFIEGGANFIAALWAAPRIGRWHRRRACCELRRDNTRYCDAFAALCHSGTCRDTAYQTTDRQVRSNVLRPRSGCNGCHLRWRSTRQWRSTVVAIVWGHKSIACRARFHGNRVLPLAAKQADPVRGSTNVTNAADAGVGDALESV